MNKRKTKVLSDENQTTTKNKKAKTNKQTNNCCYNDENHKNWRFFIKEGCILLTLNTKFYFIYTSKY